MALGCQRDAAELSRHHLGSFRQAHFVGLGTLSEPADPRRCFRPNDLFADAPLDLRNRRRVWRVLSDMDFSTPKMVMQDGWRDYKKVGTTAEAELMKRIHEYDGKNPDRTPLLS